MNASDIIPAIPRNFEQLLADIGLQKRQSAASYVLPVMGVFAAGALVGGLLGLLLAPSSGTELRSDLSKKLRSASKGRSGNTGYGASHDEPEDHHPQS